MQHTLDVIAQRYGSRPTKYWTRHAAALTLREVSCELKHHEIGFEIERELASEAAKCAGMLALSLALAASLYAQAGGTSPRENAVNVLQQAFTGPIAKGLALIAIVVGGLTEAAQAVQAAEQRERR